MQTELHVHTRPLERAACILYTLVHMGNYLNAHTRDPTAAYDQTFAFPSPETEGAAGYEMLTID